MSRKYTLEQLTAEIARPKRKGGRPRKYATEEERRDAINASHRRGYQRKKDIDSGVAIGSDLVPRKNRYETEDQRREARARTQARIYAAHRTEINLRKMASYVRCKL